MEEHVIDEGVDLERLVNGEHATAPRRGRGRPRKDSVVPESQGLTFSAFEADMLADELEDRAADIVRDNADDKYLQRRAKFLKDTAKLVRDQHQS